MRKAFKIFGLLAVCLAFVLAIRPAVYATSTDPIQNGSVGLEGVIKSNPPTQAATITFPSNGQTFTSLPVKVGGSCPGDVLVKVFSNGVFVGSAQCVNGSYSLSIDLFPGQNQLIARVYDALDQAGPDSATVTVTYTQTGFNSSGPQITLTSVFAKRGANPGDTLNWPVILSGGTGPYAISVDWGDGNVQLISRSLAGEIDLSHKYASPGIYTIIIKVTDSAGNSAFLQLVGVGNGALSQDNIKNTGNSASIRVVYIWWPLFVAAALIIISFWLGGRNKLESLRKQAEKRIQY